MQNHDVSGMNALRRRQILMFGPGLSRSGGVRSVAKTYLEAWDYSRHYVTYISTSVEGNHLNKLIAYARAHIDFARNIVSDRPSIIHVHFSWRASFWRKAIIAGITKLLNIPLVMHCHSSRFDRFFDQAPRVIKWLIQANISMADLLLVVSPEWKQYFSKLAPDVQIRTMPNPVTIPNDASAKLGNESESMVLFVGRMQEHKGIYDLIKAIPKVLAKQPDVRFVLAGDGEVEAIRSIIRAQSWNSQVVVPGYLQSDERDRYLGEAAIFVLPSHNEGLPVAMLEAMAHSIPVVSCPVGGVPQVVLEGETGLLVPVGQADRLVEAIVQLLSKPEQRHRMGRNARRLVEHNNEVHLVLDRLYLEYDRILANN